MCPVIAARNPVSTVSWIAHFAHQNHVRVLAQRRTQDSGEGQFDFLVDLDLIDAGQPIFDRVFHGDYLALRRIELFECGIERRRLATPVGPVTNTMPLGAG
jgi:hypothetical protein